MIEICSVCGSAFTVMKFGQMFCTVKCRRKNERKHNAPPQRNCFTCGCLIDSHLVFCQRCSEERNKKCAYSYTARFQKEARLYLKDSYVKQMIRTQTMGDPTQQQIEEKRLSIKIKRLIHEKQRAIKSSGSNDRTI
jgi:hypothetical protein